MQKKLSLRGSVVVVCMAFLLVITTGCGGGSDSSGDPSTAHAIGPTAPGRSGQEALPPPSSRPDDAGPDKLGVFDAADTDGSGGISEDEFKTLTGGIAEVTGAEFSGGFSDYDLGGDSLLSGAELKSVLDDAGFSPPPMPPRQAADAYAAQSGTDVTDGIEDEDLLVRLLEYLKTRSEEDDVDITV